MERYFKRKWEESRGDEFDSWGSSVWYFELGEDFYPIRQIECYKNGNRLKYHLNKLYDEYGGLGDQALELSEFKNFEINKKEFEQEWEKVELIN